jgi:hypothetical protein
MITEVSSPPEYASTTFGFPDLPALLVLGALGALPDLLALPPLKDLFADFFPLLMLRFSMTPFIAARNLPGI